jgi:putative drug exporter of the RND superfamily
MHRILLGWSNIVYRARWAVVLTWVVLVVLGGAVFGRLPDLLSGGGWDVPGSQSKLAGELLASEFEGRSASSLTLIVRDPNNAAGTPAYNERLTQVIDRLQSENGVAGVFSLMDASEGIRQGMIGSDPHVSAAYVDLSLKMDYAMNVLPDYQERITSYAESLGVEAYLLGTAAFQGENAVQSQEGLARAELIVFPLIIIILLIVFRSVVSTITPLIVTIASVLAAMGIVYAVAREVELSVFVTNSAMMLGLGVGIDYSLFMVNRFKQELTRHGSRTSAALAAAMATAGHTVLFSAITVIAALSALFVVPIPAIRAIAFGGIAVVFVAGLASLSLLPAVLGILGPHINAGRIPLLDRPKSDGRPSAWKRWTAAIMRRPALVLVLTLGVLALLAFPAAGMKLYSPDLRVLPADTAVRQGFTLLEQSFGVGATSPMSIVLRSENGDLRAPEAYASVAALHETLTQQPHVTGVSSIATFFPGVDGETASKLLQAGEGALPADVERMADRYISADGRTAVLEVQLDQYGSSDIAKDTAALLQNEVLPEFALPAGVAYSIGGETMSGIEISAAIKGSLLPALGIMLVLIFLILVGTFRSLLLPLKAIVLNLFSVAATTGILVLVFAEGYGAELFNAETNGSIIHFVPVLLLALLFGLSTDYEVFLVSRMKEHYDATGDNDASIAEGMEKTGPLITGAAVLMFAVFAGFAFSGALPIQMLGFAMAIAIALDATVVRMLLVPVSMKLLGRLNWWMPGRARSRQSQASPATPQMPRPVKAARQPKAE